MTQVWQLVLLWGFVVGVGTGLTAMVLGGDRCDALVHRSAAAW